MSAWGRLGAPSSFQRDVRLEPDRLSTSKEHVGGTTTSPPPRRLSEAARGRPCGLPAVDDGCAPAGDTVQSSEPAERGRCAFDLGWHDVGRVHARRQLSPEPCAGRLTAVGSCREASTKEVAPCGYG